MTGADYRVLAATERAAASATPLIKVRERHLRSADALEGMAERLERQEATRARAAKA